MTVTAQMVKELRDSTGAGMMDAKEGLGGNRKATRTQAARRARKGLAKAAEKRTVSGPPKRSRLAWPCRPSRCGCRQCNWKPTLLARTQIFRRWCITSPKTAFRAKDVEALKTPTSRPAGACGDLRSRRHHRRKHEPAPHGQSLEGDHVAPTLTARSLTVWAASACWSPIEGIDHPSPSNRHARRSDQPAGTVRSRS